MAGSSKLVKKAKAQSTKPGKKTVNRKSVRSAAPSTTKKKTARDPVKKKAAPKKKAIAKKAPSKKIIAKPAATISKKKIISSRIKRPRTLPAKRALPPDAELSEETVEKAANDKSAGNGQMKLPSNGSVVPLKTEDPLKAFDRHAAEKAVAKGDPQHKLQFSQTNNRQIKPSGKKPLWRK